MASISKVVVVQRDRRAGQAVRLGFEREGADVVVAGTAEDGAQAMAGGGVGLVVAGASSVEEAGALLRRLAAARTETHTEAPLLYIGNGASRRQALDAGADEVLPPPAYVRDVVTVGKLLAGMRAHGRGSVSGDLGDTFGVFYLVRALAATGRSAVLSLVRGLRRGEVRFFEGEVTSASVGGLHGQAGLHQLLLWTEARFDLRWEDVVRRRQIPMAPDELLRDAERFLVDLREVAGGLSPAAVYEQDPQRMKAMAKQIPTEVHGVLRLFDGQRSVADVIEDCPFRVFETLRVAQRAAEVALIRRVRTTRPRAAARAVLEVEEWLVGVEVPDAEAAIGGMTSGPAAIESGPVRSKGGSKKKKRKRTLHGVGSSGGGAVRGTAPVASLPTEIDWAPLVPRSVGVELIGLSGVVPSEAAAGEIVVGEIRARRLSESGRVPRAASPTVEIRSQSEVSGRVVADAGADAADVDVTVPNPRPSAIPSGELAADSLPTAVPLAAPDDPTLRVTENAVPAAVPVPIDASPSPMPAAREPLASTHEHDPFDEPTPQVPLQPAILESLRRNHESQPRESPGPIPDRRSGEFTAMVAAERAIDEGPSILVEDLAAAHAAIGKVAARETAAAPTRDASRGGAAAAETTAEVDMTRSAAVAAALAAIHFTEDEEAFFAVGASPTFGVLPHDAHDDFADLDEGYHAESLWQRIMAWMFPRRGHVRARARGRR